MISYVIYLIYTVYNFYIVYNLRKLYALGPHWCTTLSNISDPHTPIGPPMLFIQRFKSSTHQNWTPLHCSLYGECSLLSFTCFFFPSFYSVTYIVNIILLIILLFLIKEVRLSMHFRHHSCFLNSSQIKSGCSFDDMKSDSVLYWS